MDLAEFDAAFEGLQKGYSQGTYEGRRFGVTVNRTRDGRRNSLFARELAAWPDHGRARARRAPLRLLTSRC